MSSPKAPAVDTVFFCTRINRFASYGPRRIMPPDERGICEVRPCAPQGADFWSVYLFESFADPADPQAGIWNCVFDCATEEAAKATASLAEGTN